MNARAMWFWCRWWMLIFKLAFLSPPRLSGFFFFERVNRRSVEQILLRNQRWQVPIAAFLGALPGCGGAIVAVTQYTRGALSFGGVVAVLTATMGDAAFLLLAKEPLAALAVFAICAPTGVVFGYLVDWIHGRDFLKVNADDYDDNEEIEENPLLSPFYRLWMLLFVPGAVIALAVAAQVDVATVFAIGGFDWVNPFGAAAALLASIMWMLNPLTDFRLYICRSRPLPSRVADMTNFITFWVICGYIAYGLVAEVFNFDLAALFNAWLYFVPLIAVFVGFIPGCGPQIVVTTLYVNGVIPFSAQLANAISNDGDALFPAIAIAPKAAILATIYTSLPALVIGYGWLFMFE